MAKRSLSSDDDYDQAVDAAWKAVDNHTVAITRLQNELDELYNERVRAYATLIKSGVSMYAIGKHLGVTSRAISEQIRTRAGR